LKIFISWSGPLSRKIAETLRDWLPSVLQTVEPYVSSEDIYKGARWGIEVSRELEVANYGILCVTAANIDAPWLNFEAGALSKSFEHGNVSPFLFGLKPSDLTGPLTQFQSTVYERDDVFKLIASINAAAKTPLESRRLHKVFQMWWPELQEKLYRAKSLVLVQEQAKGVKRSVEEMVAELVDLARAQQNMLYQLSQRTPGPTALTVELEALQKLVEELLDQGLVSPDDLTKAIPNGPTSVRYRAWLQYILSYRPANEPAIADLESSDET
jgi:hypothetical protein